MFFKVNIQCIIQDFLKVLRRSGDEPNKPHIPTFIADVFLFYGIPVIVAHVLVICGVLVDFSEFTPVVDIGFNLVICMLYFHALVLFEHNILLRKIVCT